MVNVCSHWSFRAPSLDLRHFKCSFLRSSLWVTISALLLVLFHVAGMWSTGNTHVSSPTTFPDACYSNGALPPLPPEKDSLFSVFLRSESDTIVLSPPSRGHLWTLQVVLLKYVPPAWRGMTYPWESRPDHAHNSLKRDPLSLSFLLMILLYHACGGGLSCCQVFLNTCLVSPAWCSQNLLWNTRMVDMLMF